MKTPVNAGTLRQHLTYSWWKYALMIILGTLAVNLLYTVTAYRSPAEKKVELYVYGLADEQKLKAYMEEVQSEKMPDMEEMNVLLLTTDATYGPMQLSTYIAAGEGDLYILPRDEFVSLASSGAWLPLEDEQELVTLLSGAGVNLQSGWRRDADTGVSHLYGIPIAKLPGLADYLYVENGYLCALISGGNDENTFRFLRILCEDMLKESSATQTDLSDPAETDNTEAPAEENGGEASPGAENG